ncbi:MAG TPA: LysR family transcriptional regulator [Nevskiaceae bacterium]|nr:LysR family transcriptional regulator [Nevskiaceae bacterium]
MSQPRISLEQWRSLISVVESGGYAQAAEALHKSQSAITYAVQKLESSLGVKAFEIEGRKAKLTPTGQMLYRRAKALLEEAGRLESASKAVSAGWEAEIGIAADVVFPSWLMVDCLAKFGQESPHTHVELYESVIFGTEELLLQGRVQIAIGSTVPTGFLGDPLMTMRFVLAAHPDHPLHKLGRKVTSADLRAHRHLVVRDTATTRTKKALSLEADQRWTLSHMSTSIQAASRGYGFAWYPVDRIRDEIARGLLKPVPVTEGGERSAQLYLVLADRDAAGPGVLRLVEIIREAVGEECKKELPKSSSSSASGSPASR